MRRTRPLLNPLDAISAVKLLSADERLTEQILAQHVANELRHGGCSADRALIVTRALVMGMVIASDMQNRPQHALFGKALQLWLRCSERSVSRMQHPEPTTTERRAVVGALLSWIDSLDRVMAGSLHGAEVAWNNLRSHYEWGAVSHA